MGALQRYWWLDTRGFSQRAQGVSAVITPEAHARRNSLDGSSRQERSIAAYKDTSWGSGKSLRETADRGA